MSAPSITTVYEVPARDSERGHRIRVALAWLAAIALLAALAFYGADYYWLSAAERPFSDKHHLLRPSGTIGIKLGMLGVGMFLLIFLYPLRKRIGWLARRGKSKHWLDFHIVLGISAPVVIAFHASFKFHGIAGLAFWIMFAVAVSGIIGRYVYAQIPRSLDSAEISAKELEAQQNALAAELGNQKIARPADLAWIGRIPSTEQARRMPLYRALLVIVFLDLLRPFHVARLRRHVLGWSGIILSFGGLFRTTNLELERVVEAARRKSSLSKRIAFLSRSQQVFHLWHVVHRPFSYSFAVLAMIHIGVVLMLGYFR